MSATEAVSATDGEVFWLLVDEVEKCFAEEVAAPLGQLRDRTEATNSVLRTAWPFVLHALKRRRAC